ncbi:MAG: hypothetical protein Kow00121_52030 [Elainellaceae cyanobacterium]
MTNRWFIYQQEQFPIIRNGLFLAGFSFATIGYCLLLQDGAIGRSLLHLAGLAFLAFLNVFLCFLQLQIANEFKDFSNHVKHHPNHPVSRGLVTLQELGILGIATGAIQLGLALSANLSLVWLLLLLWGYVGLITREFFAPQWFRTYPVVTLLVRSIAVSLIALYASAWSWLTVGASVPQGLERFLLLTFLTSLLMQTSQIIGASNQEAVTRKQALPWGQTLPWRRQKLVIAWLGIVWLMSLAALLAAAPVQFVVPIALLLLFLLTASVAIAWRFLAHPVRKWASGVEFISLLWGGIIYFNLGILPLLLQR